MGPAGHRTMMALTATLLGFLLANISAGMYCTFFTITTTSFSLIVSPQLLQLPPSLPLSGSFFSLCYLLVEAEGIGLGVNGAKDGKKTLPIYFLAKWTHDKVWSTYTLTNR